MQNYITLDKKVGETPLACAEAWRKAAGVDASVPLAYAGRLDPMASGKLLVLLGDECKNQTDYHDLDKLYYFSILLNIESDSLDVLGRLQTLNEPPRETDESLLMKLEPIITDLLGDIELPYPKFSAKTVQGKPLHMWTLENRLDEISIPTKHSTIYKLAVEKIETINRAEMVRQALEKINSIPEVTDPRKALGNDFRRKDVRADWDNVLHAGKKEDEFKIIHLSCLASSGTYMRTLASLIAEKLGTVGLAWSIHRAEIGIYDNESTTWRKKF